MELKKVTPSVVTYELRFDKNDTEYTSCTWANFIFDLDNYRLTINSDAGDYSYGWYVTESETFLHLMSRVDMYYMLGKMSSRSKFYLDESKRKTIERIEEYIFGEYDLAFYNFETEEDWEDVKSEINNIDSYCDEMLFYHTVSNLIPDIDFEDIEIVKDYPPQAYTTMKLFEQYIQPAIKEEIKKSDSNLEIGADGHTKYLQGINVPIMVNSVFDSENHCTPTDVSEMHLGTVNGEQVLLITPSVISLPE